MCYTGWCPFEKRTGPNDTKCERPADEKCPLMDTEDENREED